ncbi:MAG TPA: hypothetical protein VMN60_04635 [Longimicrobiales bacterium]|nr:hypothetical protein [Longimicrobiales bacterium]
MRARFCGDQLVSNARSPTLERAGFPNVIDHSDAISRSLDTTRRRVARILPTQTCTRPRPVPNGWERYLEYVPGEGLVAAYEKRDRVHAPLVRRMQLMASAARPAPRQVVSRDP